MEFSIFNNSNFQTLKKSLDGTSFRHKLIANNLANQNTPNFMAQDLDFGMFMASNRSKMAGLMTTNPKHLSLNAGLQDPNSFSGDLAGRAMITGIQTHPEEEMVKMAENSIHYQASSEILARNYSMLNLGIVGSVK